MVQVLREPYEETEPILSSTVNEDTDVTCPRKNSYSEEAYRSITTSMKADPLKIENLIVALNLFSTAVKVQNVPLAKQCIEILDNHIEKKNVLRILSHVSKCKMPLAAANDFEPSAPPIVENDNQRTEDWVQKLIDDLCQNCLLEIDKNADFILKQNEILELTYSDILSITTRDTLQVSSETIVYSAIMRWCVEECKRRTLQVQPINMKAVLRELVYSPRYGLMTKKEFQSRTIDGIKGPTRSGILEEQEKSRILQYIKKFKNKPLDELPYKGSQPRIISMKNGQCGNKSTCDKWLINFLTCWTAVFD